MSSNVLSSIFIFCICLIGCKSNQLFNDHEIKSLGISKKELKSIYNNEPELIRDIIEFRKNNTNDFLEKLIVNDFIGLQNCEKPSSCFLKNFNNEFQYIFEVFNSIEKNQLDWLHKEEFIYLKNNFIKFMINHPNEKSAKEHIIQELKQCIKDPDYVKLIYSASGLN